MGRLATANAVQFAITAMGGSVGRAGQPEESHRLPEALSSTPVASGHRSERVLSLLMALEALRAAPDILSAGRRGH